MRKQYGRFLACLLIGAMLLLQGCAGKEGGPDGQTGGGGSADAAPEASAEGENGGERSMGRYLEKEITLPEDVAYGSSHPTLCLQKLSTGELALLEQTAGMYVSGDHGESWTRKETPWLRELREDYIAHMAVAPDGSVALVYVPHSEETEESEDAGYQPEYLYVDPAGNAAALTSPDGGNIHQLWFGKDSRLYAYTLSGMVYEMDPAGGAPRKLFEGEGLSDYMCFTDQYLIDIGSRGLLFYDMENEIVADADRVLKDFITENVGGEIGANSGSYTVVMAEGEEADVVYLAFKGGLYRHVIGGTAVEQVMEGSLSSLGDPKMGLAGMAVLPDNEFAILYTNGKMYRYVYDPDIPTIPDQQVSIYSLTENYAVRQAVSLFQKQHPEAYVRYEIGMDTGSGMTSEDAIKNLNTRIMSGSGPDLLVLDGLPRHSYEEKGVLMDLTEIAGGMSGEDALFPNLVDACREDGKLYYLPLRFRMPLLVGDPDTVAASTDLAGLADAVEALREKYPQGALTGLAAEGKLLRTLGITSSGSWTDPKTGAIDQAKLKEFLTQAKRIYEAETAGLNEEEQKEYKTSYDSSLNWSGAMEYFGDAGNAGMNIAMGEQKIGMGITYMIDGDFNMISTLANQEENFAFGVWNGQIRNGFIPKGMVGISTASKDSDLAQTFFRFLFGKELQDIEVSTGLPMNVASFEHLKENQREEDMGISIGTSGSDGIGFSLDIRWATEEDFEALKRMVESAAGVCAGDAVIEEVVYDVGQRAVNGSISVDDAVAEIQKKAAIYLAE